MPGSGLVSVIAPALVLPLLRLVTNAFFTFPQAKRSRVPHKPRPLAPPFPRVFHAFKISYENSTIRRA